MERTIQQWSFTSFEDMGRHKQELESFFSMARRREDEIRLTKAGQSLEGYSEPTDRAVAFKVAWPDDGGEPNWRETLVCPISRLNNRSRATIHFAKLHGLNYNTNLYCTEQSTSFYSFLKSNYGFVTGSEYDPSVPFGTINLNGFRSEDMTALTFKNRSLDMIISCDVLEHVPEYKKALNECFRTLAPEGKLILTAPFAINSPTNIVRAVVTADGSIEHLLPAEYHGDPIRSEGVLCYYHFGWELLDELRSIGFSDTKAILYWSESFGYLGCFQLIIVAER